MSFGIILKEALKNFFTKPVTTKYPFEPTLPPDKFRGLPIHLIEACTGCGLCEKDCPADAIKMIPDERTRKKQAPEFYYWKCIRCAQCYYSCPFDAIFMSKVFEVSVYDKTAISSEAIHK